ncbi:MAG: MazG family protein [Candidatus Eisenbacteria bacterium]|uniref:MazG family protein n=1 Tax=Eiseniibacteriota bacterium TaxID=2212470 RepID=A0A937X9C0_UNCEI|nr:MazG family protein [Candidatus Eisenbacteria bacterium]
MDAQVSPDWDGLRALCRRLRAPAGCGWDRAQTLASLSPYLLEETHEVLEALAENDGARLMEEIGDLLFLLAFLVTIAEEEGRFTFAELARATASKMIRRHPHVFGEPSGGDPRSAGREWERAKLAERRERGSPRDRLASGAAGLPALLEAYRVQEKAAGAGFDWPGTAGVLEKLDEERAELARALGAADAARAPAAPAAAQPPPRPASPPPPTAPAPAEAGGGQASAPALEEVGDLLFTLVNLARHMGADPEQLLKRTTRKFRTRFAGMEAHLVSAGIALEDADLETMERAWQRSKADETRAAPGPDRRPGAGPAAQGPGAGPTAQDPGAGPAA